MSRPKADKFISVEAVAEMIALAPKTILAGKCGTDELLRVELGKKKTVFSRNDVEAWIKRRLEAAREARKDQALLQKEETNVIPLQRPGLKRDDIRDIADIHRVK